MVFIYDKYHGQGTVVKFHNFDTALVHKEITFGETLGESFGMALSMAVELSGSATMLTVTSLAWAKTTGMSSKERMIDM